MSEVVLLRCETYDYSLVKSAIDNGMELIGADKLFAAGEQILLKPNLLAPEPPERCVTTHPVVFKAMAANLLARGVRVTYGDSPMTGSPERVARKTGILEVAEELGLEMADFSHGQDMLYQSGQNKQHFTIARGVTENDGLVSLPKLKTHALTTLTGAIKNQFGCIPGALKKKYHITMPLAKDFAAMLVKLNLLIKPRMFVMDGIIAMEGNGPRGGNPRPMHMLLLSTDPVALDATVCRIIGLRPEKIATLKYGQALGLGTYDSSKINLLGDIIENFRQPDFALSSPLGIVQFNTQFWRNRVMPRPEIDADACIHCGLCTRVCPISPAVVGWQDQASGHHKPPEFDYNRCIRCYCCQESCPEGAIHLTAPLMGKLLRTNRKH